ncbi:MAG: FG-GAP repeat protein [Phycisphaerae bacterium]|nr:FG-GAP repeat protein [Phycisphaerae bacterium]
MTMFYSRSGSCFVRCAVVAALVLALWIPSARAEVGDPFRVLTASDAEAYDDFGVSVAIHGTTAIVGAYGDNDDAGSAYLYNVTTGQELHKLTASDAGTNDEFGNAVSISGNYAIVGAYSDNSYAGSAYLYNVATGQELHKLTASETESYDNFGNSVGISGNTAIVGAPFHDGSGAAYLFNAATGEEGLKLTADDIEWGDSFGWSVAIDGNIAIVGAYCDDDAVGSAYLFDVTTGSQFAKLTPNDCGEWDMFGHSVAISGNVAIVGALRTGTGDGGAAYLFDVTTGQQLRKLTASDAETYDDFGVSVAIHGTTAIVGAYGDDDGGSCAGSAYLFDVTTGDQLAKLTASDPEGGDSLGVSVAIADGLAVAGVYGDDYGLGSSCGSAHVFEAPLPEPTTMGLLIAGGLALLRRRNR